MAPPMRTVIAASLLALSVLPISLGLSLGLGGCSKDDPKDTPKAAPKTPEKIPEDFVMNDFFQDGKTAKPIVDASVEGGLFAGAGDGGAGAAAAATGGGDEDGPSIDRKFKVTEPGAEPRAPRRYAFKPTPETRVMTMKASITREAGGQRQAQEQPLPALTLTFTAKPKGKGFRMEGTIQKLELPPENGKPPSPEAVAALAALKGVGVSLDVTPRGGLGEVKFEGKQVPKGADEILGLVNQAFEVILAPLPEEPIGVGGKWEEQATTRERGIEAKTTTTFTLKEWGDGGVIIDGTTIGKSPKQALKGDPRIPPGATVEIEQKNELHYELKPTAVATKVTADTSKVVKVEVPQGGKTMTETQTIKVKIAIDTPAK